MDTVDMTFRRDAAQTVATPVDPEIAPPRRRRFSPGALARPGSGWALRQLMRWRRGLMAILILGLGIAGMATLVATKPEVTREARPERVWTVDVVTATRADHRPEIRLLGTVDSGRTAELRPLVAGTVASVSPALKDGGVIRAGEPLLTIEPLDYKLIVAETEASLDQARARLDELRANLQVRERDAARAAELFKKGAVAAPRFEESENALRVEQARVRQQEAQIAQLEAKLTKAQTDLARTELRAPFDAFVGRVNAEEGMRVSQGDRVAVLSGAEGLEAAVNLPTDAYGRLVADGGGIVGRPAEVVWRLGDTTLTYPARVERVVDRITTAAGGVTLYVRLEGNFVDAPLRPGAFVDVLVPDRSYDGVVQLPPTALHGEETVYVVGADDRLQARTVEVVARDNGAVYVGKGLEAGDRIVTTRFQEIAPGLKVGFRGQPAAPAPEAQPKQEG